MSKMHRILSVLLCAAVLLTLWGPAALAAGENLHEEDAISEALAQSGAQEEPKELLRQEESAEGTPEGSAPEASPETTPETTPMTSPETTPETSPETTPETSPGTTPEESPAESPEESPEQSPAGEYTISYDYNGGAAGALFRLTAQNEPENGTPESGAVTGNEGQIIVLAEAPVKPDRDFAGWKSALTGRQYAAGEEYEIQGDDTLVAQWNMLRILEIDAQPEEDSALLECENTVSAISEEEQALVEQAVRDAQPQQDNDLLPDEDEVQVLAVDVSFLDGSGRPQQPAEGETVPMTVTVPAGALDGEGFWMVYHLVEKAEGGYTAVPVQFMSAQEGGSSVQLAADGFSIYAVAKVRETDGTEIVQDETVELPVESSQVFYFKDDIYSYYTYHRYTWTVEGNDDIIRAYVTPMDNLAQSENRYQYPWLSVDALREGEVTVKLNYYYYNGSDWWKPNNRQTVSGTVSFKIKVTEPSGLRIVNNIIEDGTLVPVYENEDGTFRTDLTYVWSAQFFHTYNKGNGSPERVDEDSSINPDALYGDGRINVAIDNGGMRDETDADGNEMLHVTVYTVTAYDADNNEVGKATHRVEVGGDIINGSFEYPVIPGGTGMAYANGTRQLFWRTTAPGEKHMLGQDVELGNDSSGNPYLLSGSAADGSQYAELNAEAMGTLYQDVLTAPGATLSWSFSHRSRMGTGSNTMYLIIAASRDGAKITNQSQVNALIDCYTDDGETVTYDGGKYTMWKMESNVYYWENHFGTYSVPDGQYATRFFFASATGTTMGNLIDQVSFNQEQRYIIEYYLNGSKVDELTEIGSADLNAAVSPAHMNSDVLSGAILTDSTLNGAAYGGVTMTILARPTSDAIYTDSRNVLRLYFVSGAITVRKVVTIEDWDDLTDDERKELGGDKPYVAYFDLYKGTPGTGDKVKVAKTSVSIDLVQQSLKTGISQFMRLDDPTKPYVPEANAAYWVEEVESNDSTQTPLYAYSLTTTYAPAPDGSFTTDAYGNGSVTVTNAYTLDMFKLTIKTTGVEAIDENQTFVFRIRGTDEHTRVTDLTITIHGDGQSTVLPLAQGQYEVTQINSWSWRYTPEQTTYQVTIDADKTVEYTQKRAHEGDTGNAWKWLNGQHWIDNRWKDDSSDSGTSGDEGGDQPN